jgi:hypothetical protein
MSTSIPAGIAAAIAATVLAACGSSLPSTSGSSSSGGPQTRAQLQQDAVSFADCVRSHGVPTFPDPTTSPRAFKTAFNTQSPAFHSAETGCAHLLPGGGPRNQSEAQSPAQVAELVAFARCMRGHGFPSFPDPTSSGQLTHEMLANAGINLHQPAVVPAADACVGVTHGVITKAAVVRFVAGQ